MKPFAIILLAVSFLISAELKTGYYLKLKDFIANTPTAAKAEARVVEGRGDAGTQESAFFVEEKEGAEFKRVHGESFEGYCDSGKAYLVDNADMFKGRIMRSVVIGTKYSYYYGVAHTMTSMPGMKFGVMGGLGSGKEDVQTLVIIDMKTGDITEIGKGMFPKSKMKEILEPYADLLAQFKNDRIQTNKHIATAYIDKINAMPN